MLPFIVFFMYSASFEVDVNCWWNRAQPVGHNVSVVCHTSARGRAKSCDLFQLWVITPAHRHLIPSPCVRAKETCNFSIARKHTGHIRCMCNGKTNDTCNVTVRGGCEYNRIDLQWLHYWIWEFSGFHKFYVQVSKFTWHTNTQRSLKGIVYKEKLYNYIQDSVTHNHKM